VVRKRVSPKKPASRRATIVSDGLEGVSFYLGRAYYRYIALVESALQEIGVAGRVRPGMGHVLFALFEKDDRVIKEIAERADVSPSTLTGILRQMQRHGLIERRADAEDGRAVRVRLTPRAKALEKRLRGAQVRVQRVMYADLSDAELRTLKRSLARMAAAMRDYELRRQRRARSHKP
jgi:DNA-binding MarR family transcriptional regulator